MIEGDDLGNNVKVRYNNGSAVVNPHRNGLLDLYTAYRHFTAVGRVWVITFEDKVPTT